MKKGEITVFLSLTVVLLVSFILGMMNAANIQLMKNQARIDVDSALYSLFGEYQTDLLEEYHIFGIEETYGTGNLQEENLQEENLLRRMHYFGTKGIVHEIKGIQYLTDLDGMGLREQIITYMEQKYGIEYARNLAGMTGEWEEVEIQEKEAKENQNQGGPHSDPRRKSQVYAPPVFSDRRGNHPPTASGKAVLPARPESLACSM